jgi:TPR repeat protein
MNEADQPAIALAMVQDPILNLAIRYLKDQGFILPLDGCLARDWCKAQAKLGIADAQVACGVLLSLGIFGEQDAQAARFWFQSAADQDHPAALLMLAGLIEAGSDGDEPNVSGAMALVQRAVEKEYPPALVQIAVDYLNGINVEEDRNRALVYLRKAAMLGEPTGQFLLGANLLKETDAEAIQEGIHWLEVAAENGCSNAHRHLAYLFRDGDKGVQQSKERSERHFLVAKKIEDSAGDDFVNPD